VRFGRCSARKKLPMDERARRVGENEALFRSVNEQVRGLNQTFLVEGRMRIVCECGDQSCVEQIELAPNEYEQIRSEPELFALKPGHDAPGVETVVERFREYWIVRKDPGAPEQVALATDPRR
jgi:hypothetical protein